MTNLFNHLPRRPGFWFISCTLLFLPFVYSRRVPDPSLTPRELVLGILVAAYLGYLLISPIRKLFAKNMRAIIRPVFIPYLGYLLVAGISVFVAINVQDALYDWTKITLSLAFLILMAYALSLEPEPVKLITGLILLLSFLLAVRGVYEILTVTGNRIFDHQASYFIRAYSSNRNLYSQFLVLCLPFVLYGVVRLNGIAKLFALLVSFLICILSIVLLTRSVWLAMAIATTISVLILAWKNRLKTLYTGIHKNVWWAGFGILVILVLLYAGFGDLKVFEEQMYWLSNYRFGSSLERVELWKKTLEMSADHLFIGVGQNNWKIVFPSYGILGQRQDAATIFFQRPHNDFLWVLSENGIPGLVFYTTIFIIVLIRLIRALFRNSGQNQFGFLMALLFGLLAYLVFANLSFPRERIEHQVLLHTYFALVLFTTKDPTSDKSKNMGFVLLSFFIFLGVCLNLFLSVCRFHSEQDVLRGYEYRERGNHRKVLDYMTKAERWCVRLDPFSTPFSWYRGEAYFLTGEVDKAFVSFQKAHRIHPYHLHVLNNLATCYELKGNHNRAKIYYLKALKIYPSFDQALLNLTAIYYNEDKIDSALNVLTRMPDTTKNERYERFRDVVINKKLNRMMEDPVNERVVRKSIERIRNSSDWYLKVFRQAVKNGTEYESEIYREVIYLLESVDSTIGRKQADEMLQKYILDKYD